MPQPAAIGRTDTKAALIAPVRKLLVALTVMSATGAHFDPAATLRSRPRRHPGDLQAIATEAGKG